MLQVVITLICTELIPLNSSFCFRCLKIYFFTSLHCYCSFFSAAFRVKNSIPFLALHFIFYFPCVFNGFIMFHTSCYKTNRYEYSTNRVLNFLYSLSLVSFSLVFSVSLFCFLSFSLLPYSTLSVCFFLFICAFVLTTDTLRITLTHAN